jgi:hypothetical protein
MFPLTSILVAQGRQPAILGQCTRRPKSKKFNPCKHSRHACRFRSVVCSLKITILIPYEFPLLYTQSEKQCKAYTLILLEIGCPHRDACVSLRGDLFGEWALLERVQGLGASPPFGALELTVRVPQLASNGGANTMAWPASKPRIRLLYFGTLCSALCLYSFHNVYLVFRGRDVR